MAKVMSTEDMRRLARLGAAARIVELQSELASLRAAFPGLGTPRGRKPAAAVAAVAEEAAPTRRRRRSRMSPANRRAVSVRMKKYWAEKRKEKGKG